MQGVVVPASADWAVGDVTVTFSLVMGGFAWGAVFGKYLDAWGARACCTIGNRVCARCQTLHSCKPLAADKPHHHTGAAGLGAGYGLAALATEVRSIFDAYVSDVEAITHQGWDGFIDIDILACWSSDLSDLAAPSIRCRSTRYHFCTRGDWCGVCPTDGPTCRLLPHFSTGFRSARFICGWLTQHGANVL